MKLSSSLPLIVLVIAGCATPHATNLSAKLRDKQDEVYVLKWELDVVNRQLIRTQDEANQKGNYPTEAQIRDLNYLRKVLLQAREKISAEDLRLHLKYEIDYGPY